MTAPGHGTYHYKLVLLGESAVGKSSLALRFVRGKFMENQESTIGAAFLTQSLTLKDNVVVKFEIWDTAGQERYRSLAPMYYRGAHAAIVVYDVTSKASFERAKGWVDELKSHTPHSQRRVVALVGNKLDLLVPSETALSSVMGAAAAFREEAEKYALDNNLVFRETSAKEGTNVTELFETIGTMSCSPQAEALPKDEGTQAAAHKFNVSLVTSEDKIFARSCC